MDPALEVLGVIALISVALLTLFGGRLLHALTDGRAISALAKLECPHCSSTFGMPTAQEAALSAWHDQKDTQALVGTYVPTAYQSIWPFVCPDFKAELAYFVRQRAVKSTRPQLPIHR
jgi:hypothetical protein